MECKIREVKIKREAFVSLSFGNLNYTRSNQCHNCTRYCHSTQQYEPHDLISFHISFLIIESVNFATHISRLSKHVSQRSRFRGFILSPHINWRIVTVGYNPSLHSPARSSKNTSKLGCKYRSSTNHGSMLSQYVVLFSGLKRCCITANPFLLIINNVHAL